MQIFIPFVDVVKIREKRISRSILKGVRDCRSAIHGKSHQGNTGEYSSVWEVGNSLDINRLTRSSYLVCLSDQNLSRPRRSESLFWDMLDSKNNQLTTSSLRLHMRMIIHHLHFLRTACSKKSTWEEFQYLSAESLWWISVTEIDYYFTGVWPVRYVGCGWNDQAVGLGGDQPGPSTVTVY